MHVLAPCSLVPRVPMSLRPKSSPPGFPGSWHACRQMITGAVLALLRLDGLVVHMHVVLHRRHVPAVPAG